MKLELLKKYVWAIPWIIFIAVFLIYIIEHKINTSRLQRLSQKIESQKSQINFLEQAANINLAKAQYFMNLAKDKEKEIQKIQSEKKKIEENYKAIQSKINKMSDKEIKEKLEEKLESKIDFYDGKFLFTIPQARKTIWIWTEGEKCQALLRNCEQEKSELQSIINFKNQEIQERIEASKIMQEVLKSERKRIEDIEKYYRIKVQKEKFEKTLFTIGGLTIGFIVGNQILGGRR